MTFINETKILFKKSNSNLAIFNIDNNLQYEVLDNNLNKVSCDKVYDGNFSYVDIWFDINKDDSIYGIINNNKGKLINININNNNIVNNSTLIKYDYKNFIVKFPYIKVLDNEKHIIYFSIDKKNKCFCQLIHVYNNNDIYVKNKIDYINYNIMSNFVVTWNNNVPSIFYYNKINGFEELFVSTFNLKTLNWNPPLKLTNSKKSKIYLDVIKDTDNTYHIVYSENNNFKYHCQYLKLEINEINFKILESSLIQNNIMCLFPTLTINSHSIFIQWAEYHNLYICKSINYGKTWSKPIKNNNLSHHSFLRYLYKSNYNLNNKYNFSYIFGIDKSYDLDMFIPKDN